MRTEQHFLFRNSHFLLGLTNAEESILKTINDENTSIKFENCTCTSYIKKLDNKHSPRKPKYWWRPSLSTIRSVSPPWCHFWWSNQFCSVSLQAEIQMDYLLLMTQAMNLCYSVEVRLAVFIVSLYILNWSNTTTKWFTVS